LRNTCHDQGTKAGKMTAVGLHECDLAPGAVTLAVSEPTPFTHTLVWAMAAKTNATVIHSSS
jgi:hypothetical protein